MQDFIDEWFKELRNMVIAYSVLAIFLDGDLCASELSRELEIRSKNVKMLNEVDLSSLLPEIESHYLVASYVNNNGDGHSAGIYYHLTENGKSLLNELIVELKMYRESMDGTLSHTRSHVRNTMQDMR